MSAGMLFRVGQPIVAILRLPDPGDGGTSLFRKVSCCLPVHTA